MQNHSNDNDFERACALLKQARIHDAAFSEGMGLLQQAARNGHADAAIVLADQWIQHGSLHGADARAVETLQPLARAGHPLAMLRMADLYLWGYGVQADPVVSFKLYQHLAHSGFMPLTTLAYLYSAGIGTEADELKAADLLLLAAAQGDTLAFMLLADRYWHGLGVPRDATLALAYWQLAEKREFPGASGYLQRHRAEADAPALAGVEAMVQRLIALVQTLDARIEALLQCMDQSDPQFARQYLQAVGQHLMDANIPVLAPDAQRRGHDLREAPRGGLKIVAQGWHPKVFSVDDFASYAECQHLIDQALPALQSTEDQRRQALRTEVDAFSGATAFFAQNNATPVSRSLQQRFALLCQKPLTHFEPVSVLRYRPGHDYSPHSDAFDEARIRAHEQIGDYGGQRLTTNLLYLLPADAGGETEYLHSGVKISGRMGRAVIHHNADDDHRADPASLHTGHPVQAGEKWLMRTAVRQHPLYGSHRVKLNVD